MADGRLEASSVQIDGQLSVALNVSQVRAFFRENRQAGRIFIIQGEVQNLSTQVFQKILVQGKLNDTQNNPIRQAVIYAGPSFSLDELRELSLQQIQSRLSSPLDSDNDGLPYMIEPGGNLPFMVVLANLPENISDYLIEIVGWEAIE